MWDDQTRKFGKKLCLSIMEGFFLLLHINTKMHKWKIIKLQQSSGKILFLKHFSYFLDLFFKVTPVLKPLIYFTIVIHKKWKKCTTVTSHFMNDKKKKDFFLFFIINFQKENTNTFTLLIILIVKCLQIELHSTNLLIWPPNLPE